jgi:hypothetical protein
LPFAITEVPVIYCHRPNILRLLASTLEGQMLLFFAGFVLGTAACMGGIQAFAWWVDRGFDIEAASKPTP